jgi:DNA helicase-2/ATP-dependent DNA helicase PcrA
MTCLALLLWRILLPKNGGIVKQKTDINELISSLNEEQRTAVERLEGPLLIVAGAGTGKTRVVTLRIANLIDHGIPPSQILALTFTNKAASEMKERVEALTSYPVLVSTFHSLGARILRESIELLGWRRNFVIYDSEDVEKLIKSCFKELGYKEQKGDVKIIISLISKAKNALLMPTEVDVDETPSALQTLFPRIFTLYKAKLKESNAVDFDDLLVLPLELFQSHPAVLEHYQNRWRHVLIDEYQDTNAAQYTMMRYLVEKHNNICVVGDPDQSIYSWRGAAIENILNFAKHFPGTHVVNLEQNYRSSSNILEAANAVIERNNKRLDKTLRSDLGAGEKICLHTASDDRSEAFFIAQSIAYHRIRHTIPYKEMVVFYRTNAQSRAIEDRLLMSKIPYCIVGGLSFYQRREIKDILAFMRVASSGNDFVSFSRTINLPKRGLGDATLEKFRQGAIVEKMPLLDYCKSLLSEGAPQKLTAKQREGLTEYFMIIDAIQACAQNSSVSEIVKTAIKTTGYIALLKEEPESYPERLENLDALVSKAIEWETEVEEPSLSLFLEELALKSTLDEAESPEDRVHLMTIHNGKGLEFLVTFLAGMEEDLFPHANSRGNDAAVEEERRLCYVGMTRAKKHLYLSHSSLRYLWGSERFQRPSRFLKEIPSQYVTKLFGPPSK